MNSVSIDPPEPLTSVKQAARRFTSLFSETDSLGVVSFANSGNLVQPLTNNLSERLSGVNSVNITAEAEVGYTNIADALRVAEQNLQSRSNGSSQQAVILLTDGLPTAPDGEPDPESAAIAAARQLSSRGIGLFAIGLGDGVNTQFLNQLVQNRNDRVFQTSNVDELSVIYSQIATAVCERAPYQVEIYPNIGLN